MKLIVGLGNPEKEYKNTRHNFGFRVLNALQEQKNFSQWEEKKNLHAFISKGTLNDDVVVLAKPTTFMNKSGEAIAALNEEYPVSLNDIIIVHDDADLTLGTLKQERERGSGGHNGVRSIIAALNSNDVMRLRLGIRTLERDQSDLDDFALSPFREEELPTVDTMVKKAIEILSS